MNLGVAFAPLVADYIVWTALVVAIVERDIIVVQNLVLLYAGIFVLVNVLVDMSYAWLDPRIRYQ